jgi:Protein of unknown function (DUF3102)
VSKSKANKTGIAVLGQQKNGAPTDRRINRTLEVIADELRGAFKTETADIIKIGILLLEAKQHVKHGEWLPWLQKEFSLSSRSAEKYMRAADFVAKNELSSNLNLSPSALYLLSETENGFGFWEGGYARKEATAAVLKAAGEQRIGVQEAKKIARKVRDEKAAADDAEAERKNADARALEIKRIEWEAAHPEEAKREALEEAQREAMADEMAEAKRDARLCGEQWSEIKEDWIEEWKSDNWTDDEQAGFEEEYARSWKKDHGTPEEKAAIQAESEARRAEFVAEDKARIRFARLVSRLKKLATEPIEKFTGAADFDDLQKIANFLVQVAGSPFRLP